MRSQDPRVDSPYLVPTPNPAEETERLLNPGNLLIISVGVRDKMLRLCFNVRDWFYVKWTGFSPITIEVCTLLLKN